MRVGFNARLLAGDAIRGFNRYTAELVRALSARGVEVVLFSDAPIHPAHALEGLRGVEAVVHRAGPQWRWQHGWLPGALVAAKVDVFHAPAHWGVPWRSAVPVVATIHDLADRELPALFAGVRRREKLRHRFEEWLVVRRAAAILTVSVYSAASIARHLGVAMPRITVTVEGAAPAFRPIAPADAADAAGRVGLSGPFFLFVGGFDARKNLAVLLHALARSSGPARPTLALVGGTPDEADRLRAEARRLGVEGALRFLGAVPDDELACLYAAATALVLPSRLEGFGLPVVEAMHVGTPSIVSSAGSLPEIAGDAGLVCWPDDAAGFADAMHRLQAEPDLRADLAARALRRAPRFTWAKAAEATAGVYQRVVDGGR